MRNAVQSHFSVGRGAVLVGFLLALLAVAYPVFAQGETIIFLHHSCGANLIEQGGVRQGLTGRGYEFYDHGYNDDGLVLADGTWTGTNFDVPGDNTDPDGYAAIFAQPLHDPPDNTFSHLMQYDVIAFKSCFPVSNIGDDYQLGEYQSYYRSIRDRMDQYPNKIFIVVTQPPQVPLDSNPSEAARARTFVDWLQSDEYLSGHPNIFVFDFFGLLAGGDSFLRAEYRMDEYDAHPNALANQTIGPLFVDFIDQAIQSYRAAGPPPAAAPTSTPSEEVVETPEVAEAPPVEPAAPNLVDDFEAYGPGEGWDIWTDGAETSMACSPDSEMAHGGAASLLVEYSVAPGGWAGCGWSYGYEVPQDWSGGTGVSMWVRTAEADQGLDVTMHLGDLGDPTPFQAWLETPPESATGWALVELPWDSFIKPDWWGEGGLAQFDATRVVGISFDLGAPDDARNEGRLWVDDISLFTGAPPVAPAPAAPTEEAEEETTFVPVVPAEEVGEEEEEGIAGGICPLSSLSLPLVAVGVIYWRRSKGR
jgi:hypothetical protein